MFVICNFSDCDIFPKSVLNVDNLWSMEENRVSKWRWEKSTNVCVNYVTIRWSDLKLWPFIQVRTFFFEVFSLVKQQASEHICSTVLHVALIFFNSCDVNKILLYCDTWYYYFSSGGCIYNRWFYRRCYCNLCKKPRPVLQWYRMGC